MAIVFDTDNTTVIEPGARERIAKRLKDIPEINKNRPCTECSYYNPNCIISCRTSDCNFNHDKFTKIVPKPVKN